MSNILSLIGQVSSDLNEYRKIIEENPESLKEWDYHDKKRRLPLHVAVFWGNFELVELFLQMGADPNAEDALENTPMRDAATRGKYEIIKILLDYGGDPYKKNVKGVSAITWADVLEDTKLKNFLINNSQV